MYLFFQFYQYQALAQRQIHLHFELTDQTFGRLVISTHITSSYIVQPFIYPAIQLTNDITKKHVYSKNAFRSDLSFAVTHLHLSCHVLPTGWWRLRFVLACWMCGASNSAGYSAPKFIGFNHLNLPSSYHVGVSPDYVQQFFTALFFPPDFASLACWKPHDFHSSTKKYKYTRYMV